MRCEGENSSERAWPDSSAKIKSKSVLLKIESQKNSNAAKKNTNANPFAFSGR
jgi:hypothetical protein